MDVDNIAPGLDFVEVLNDQVGRCDVLIAVIGKNWLNAADASGRRRLHNPEDFVRIEIESALSQKKRVIPVLVNDAKMPRAEELPDTLRAFARCNAVRLTHERFRADVASVIRSLEQVLVEAEIRRSDSATRGESSAPLNIVAEPQKRRRRTRSEPPLTEAEGMSTAGKTLYGEAESVFGDILETQARLDELHRRMGETDHETEEFAEMLEVYGELQHKLEASDAFRITATVEKVLTGLGFTERDFSP